MPAAKANYLICYKQSAQVYSATNLQTALKTPVPKGCRMEDRRILFTSFLPDTYELCVFPLTEDQMKMEEENNEPSQDKADG